MRLDFHVLWIDDQLQTIASYSERLRGLMREEGFDLQVRSARSVEEAKGHLGDNVFVDLIDMVLVDYELGAGPKGSDSLSEIREHLDHRDIVFYSATSAAELRKVAYECGADGVYCSSREDLVDTCHGVFANLVKKVLDLDLK